jgi:hypothetical protein
MSMNLVLRIANRLRLPPAETLDGCENPELVEVTFRKTAAYQPTEPPVSYFVSVRTVLDFGGGCGRHYKQAKVPAILWAETPAMAARASELSTEHLRFFSDIDKAALRVGDIDILHSAGALQYVRDPESTLKQFRNAATRFRKCPRYTSTASLQVCRACF